jgi:hypothetical protein
MFFLLFLCDLVVLCGAKKSFVLSFSAFKNLTSQTTSNCIKSQRFCTTEEKERELRCTEEKKKIDVALK